MRIVTYHEVKKNWKRGNEKSAPCPHLDILRPVISTLFTKKIHKKNERETTVKTKQSKGVEQMSQPDTESRSLPDAEQRSLPDVEPRSLPDAEPRSLPDGTMTATTLTFHLNHLDLDLSLKGLFL